MGQRFFLKVLVYFIFDAYDFRSYGFFFFPRVLTLLEEGNGFEVEHKWMTFED